MQAIRTFPRLETDLEEQCKTVARYWDIKRALPESFK
jgi:hypothetical protein